MAEIIPVTNKYIYILLTFAVVALISYGGLQFRQKFLEPAFQQQNSIIQKYLLNESPLYGKNKPKLWVHTNYDINARNWRFSASRNNKELNQPLIQLTLKTIVDHCAQDFNICLIDDTVFEKIVPGWSFGDVGLLPHPEKARARLLGLLSIIHIYGGLVVPNSFICMQSLLPLYESTAGKTLIGANREGLPDFYFFGAKKNNSVILRCIEAAKDTLRVGSCADADFKNACINAIGSGSCGEVSVIDGALLGVQTRNREPILLDDLMGQEPLKLVEPEHLYGIYVPDDELLSRTRYSWLAETDDVLNADVIVAKYLAESLRSGAERREEVIAANAREERSRTVSAL
jgi:hypothetical protein